MGNVKCRTLYIEEKKKQQEAGENYNNLYSSSNQWFSMGGT